MQQVNQPSKTARVTGYVLSTIAVLFMLMDSGMKIVCPPFVVQASAQLGYSSPATLRAIGVALLVFVILYVIPRTAILGAILLTGFLGGAVEANVRVGQPLFNLAFPLLFGLLVWGGLWLRDVQLRSLVPLAKRTDEAASAAGAVPVPAR